MNFLTDSVLIILIDLMNFRLTGYAKLYSWTTNSECVEWKYVNYMKISITRQEKNDLLIQGLLNSDDMDRFDSTAIFVLLF
jgi:hypothetical protein